MSARPSSRGVLVGVDGSASATAALRWAVAEARVRATTLCVVHVAADTDDVLDEAVAIATTDTVDEAPHVTGVRLAGSPAGVLARQSQDAEMVVVGRHGDATRLHRLLGSVTTGVLHHAHCPVAVVHADPTPTGASIHTNRQPVLVGVDGSRWSAAAVEVAFAEASARGVGVLALYVCDEAEQTPEARRRSSFWIEEGQEILAGVGATTAKASHGAGAHADPVRGPGPSTVDPGREGAADRRGEPRPRCGGRLAVGLGQHRRGQ